MNSIFIRKLARHYKRLRYLPLRRNLYYVAQVIYSESYRKRGIGLFGPRLIELTLTNRCQCRCIHCYDRADTPVSPCDELTTDEVLSVLEQSVSLGCSEVCFTGGEPTLRDDLLDLISFARKIRLIPKMNTNGLLLTREMVGKLKDAGLSWCSISIDSTDTKMHDQLRGYPGCYEKATEGLSELVRQGIPASITTYAKRERINSGDLTKIIKMGHDFKVETVRILFPVPMGGFRNAQQEVLTLEERETVRQYLKDPIVTMEAPSERTCCTAAVTKINILPDGKATPCVFVPLSYGNIRKETLKQIWNRMAEFDKCCKPAGKCPMCDEEFRTKILLYASHEDGMDKRYSSSNETRLERRR